MFIVHHASQNGLTSAGLDVRQALLLTGRIIFANDGECQRRAAVRTLWIWKKTRAALRQGSSRWYRMRGRVGSVRGSRGNEPEPSPACLSFHRLLLRWTVPAHSSHFYVQFHIRRQPQLRSSKANRAAANELRHGAGPCAFALIG